MRDNVLRRTGVQGTAMELPGSGVLPQDGSWRVVDPVGLDAHHMLTGVHVLSPTSVWVVGQSQQQPLAAHWNGLTWNLTPCPPPPAALLGAGLQGVGTAPSPVHETDSPPEPGAIAVGGGFDRVTRAEVPLVQHWNGGGWDGWNPPDQAQGYVLNDVVVFSATEAWAVGHGFPSGNGTSPAGPVALGWTGGAWHSAKMPDIPKGRLLAVSGTAPDDVWAVGASHRDGLVMHFDGNAWRRVQTPAVPLPLSDVSALSPREVWAVGRDQVIRWNGRRWSAVSSPVTGANTVTALATDDVWVAGGRGELAHFDGDRWTLADSPHPLSGTAVWLASAAADRTLWMVGSHQTTDPSDQGPHPTITAHRPPVH